MFALFQKKVPAYFLPLTIISAFLITFFTLKKYDSLKLKTAIADASSTASYNSCNITTPRLAGYNYVKPLLFVEPACESEKFSNTKNELSQYLEEMKQLGKISGASVYFKDLTNNDYIGYHQEEKHNPGSLLKVPELITFLKMEENKPGTLQNEVLYNTSVLPTKTAVVLSKTIEKGKKYSIRELLRYMISYSDNYATMLLNQRMDNTAFNKTFTDLGLAPVDIKATDYPISAREYSLFMRALFNASYLNVANSEYAAELMSTCDFKDGFSKALPVNIKLAHKFGEAMYGTDHEFHESGIFYINNKAYVLTVMTRGKDMTQLPEIIQNTCAIIYRNVSALN